MITKSSFKKKENVATKDANYFFFGHPDLDYIFNNQFMRGTITLFEEDDPTKHFLSFLRYTYPQFLQPSPPFLHFLTPE
jgi:hypothetical protein